MNSQGKKRMELKGVTKALVCNSISMIIENLNIEKYKIILIKMFKPNNMYNMKRMGDINILPRNYDDREVLPYKLSTYTH